MPNQPAAPPTTTAEEDLQSAAARASGAATDVQKGEQFAGQRRINLVWEGTQAIIAVSVTLAVIYAAVKGIDSDVLSNAFTLIIAIYFVRMNHTKIGGVGGTESRSS